MLTHLQKKKGGEWVFFPKKSFNQDFDRWWRDLLLHLIGQLFLHDSTICGVVLCRRSKGDRIEVWTSENMTKNRESVLGLKDELLKIIDKTKLTAEPEYKDHNTVIQQESHSLTHGRRK